VLTVDPDVPAKELLVEVVVFTAAFAAVVKLFAGSPARTRFPSA